MENKLDRRKRFYLMVDTEAANGLDNPYVYDIGVAVIDSKGNVYDTRSVLIYDIFIKERELMKSAYYANKIGMYEEQYRLGLRKMVRYYEARKMIAELCEKYNIKIVMAHNTRFDYKALNGTLRYLTQERQKYFLPYGIKLWDTLAMAKSVIAPQKKYIKFCNSKPEERLYEGKVRMSAEILYQFISGNEDFKEEHTGLADVMIEKEIFVRCLRCKKKMDRSPWKDKK